MNPYLLSTFLILAILYTSNALKILVYSPAFAGSHTNYLARVADTLTEAGHDVTFFIPIFDEARKNQLGVKSTKDVIVLEQDEITKRKKITIDNITGRFWKTDVTSKNGRMLFDSFYHQVVLGCGNLFRNKEMIEELRSRAYEVAIAEPLMTSGLALFRHIGIEKVVIASTCTNYDIVMQAMGEPEDTSYVPAMYSTVSGDRMNFADRVENHAMYKLIAQIYTELFEDETKVFRSHIGQDFPDWRDLIPDASLHFTNSVPYLDFPRPSIQKTIDVGGISVDLNKIRTEKIPADLEEILSRRSKSMFISFGSLAKSCEMPEEYKKNMIKVFKLMSNVTFIWKYETDDVKFAEGVENVKFVKWAPQTAILNDPRLTAFLSHGGLGSTIETAFLGKPAIMVPIFWDQPRNSQMLRRLGMTITLHKSDLGDLSKLRNALDEILNNEKYKKRAEQIAETVRNQPMKPKEMVIKYIEYVGKYGPFHHMTPYCLKMPWYQRYNYDVYLYNFMSYFFPVLIVSTIFEYAYSYLLAMILENLNR